MTDFPEDAHWQDMLDNGVMSFAAPIDRARDFAIQRHNMTSYGSKPYIVHLDHVVTVLRDYGYVDRMLSAGFLHDTIEDTGTTRGELEHRFGGRVGDLVWAVTGTGADRKARNEDIYRKLALYPDAIPLKMADRIANCEATWAEWQEGKSRRLHGIAQMYLDESLQFQAKVGSRSPDSWSASGMNARLAVAYANLRRITHNLHGTEIG